jgi:hypothetical protein
MGVGPNYVLDKGMHASGSAAYVAGHFVKLTANVQEVAMTAGITDVAFGVVMENVDATKVTTGKVTLAVRVLGIARVEASAAIAIGNKVAPEAAATGRAKLAATTQTPAGIALTAATAAGDYIDVLLTPGMPAL